MKKSTLLITALVGLAIIGVYNYTFEKKHTEVKNIESVN